MAVGAGVMIGVFLILIDLTPSDSGLTALMANRATNVTITASLVGILALVRRRRAAPSDGPGAPVRSGLRSGILFAAVGGSVDAVANSLMLLGLRLGDLTTMSVLIALSPAGTAILAAIVLHERIARIQVVGIALAIAAAALFAIP
jgi:drug/metabolite transporter (DMT)-like permease